MKAVVYVVALECGIFVNALVCLLSPPLPLATLPPSLESRHVRVGRRRVPQKTFLNMKPFFSDQRSMTLHLWVNQKQGEMEGVSTSPTSERTRPPPSAEFA